MDCPKCGKECWRDEVHNGVGMIYGPWGCPCGWSEDDYYDRSEGPSQAQKDNPGHYVDSQGGMTPLEGLKDKFDRLGLNGQMIIDEVFNPNNWEPLS